ncbi:uncharacterized protein N7503_009485 [Penicillium pulvis]|uniref:uncharacterized protein n=1 Tax=Penicillium pulvis TaxID=1562058 RepID=UPI002547F0D3|nr:uncharacterized protein N7503_009485 [Penicillium pulvis]KAJ5784273.1 hypothetical protein N7503_009485 [Penicillium pulvis]
MSYQVAYATEQDAVGLGCINNDSFQTRLMLSAMFPETDEPTLRTYKSYQAMKHLANPEAHVVKITDPTSGAVVGYGRWLIPAVLGVPPNVPELSEQAQIYAKDPVAFAPQPMNASVYAAFRALLDAGRKRYTTDRDMTLDLLATLPSHQGKGIGTAMLRWGIELADSLQTRIYLEATAEGYPLYIKYGWKHLEEIELDLEKLGCHGKESFFLMMRDPVPQ